MTGLRGDAGMWSGGLAGAGGLAERLPDFLSAIVIYFSGMLIRKSRRSASSKS